MLSATTRPLNGGVAQQYNEYGLLAVKPHIQLPHIRATGRVPLVASAAMAQPAGRDGNAPRRDRLLARVSSARLPQNRLDAPAPHVTLQQ
jgi:hypothetical protein